MVLSSVAVLMLLVGGVVSYNHWVVVEDMAGKVKHPQDHYDTLMSCRLRCWRKRKTKCKFGMTWCPKCPTAKCSFNTDTQIVPAPGHQVHVKTCRWKWTMDTECLEHVGQEGPLSLRQCLVSCFHHRNDLCMYGIDWKVREKTGDQCYFITATPENSTDLCDRYQCYHMTSFDYKYISPEPLRNDWTFATKRDSIRGGVSPSNAPPHLMLTTLLLALAL